jgi:phosphoglycerate dehydrogenase-like enzyme
MPDYPGLRVVADGIEVTRWDGTGAPPADDAELWVPPFRGADDRAAAGTLPRLRLVQLLTAGHDHVAVPDGVTLCNARGVHDGTVAEWAVAAILAAVRALPTWVRDQPAGRQDLFESDTLIGATVLLIGHGGIGRALERRLEGFELQLIRVAAHSRPGVHDPAALPRLLPRARVVVLAVPLTETTRGLADRAFLAALPDGALVVNLSRGEVVDQAALTAELTAGRLQAALDVTTPDPLPADHPLRGLPNLLYTPHVAGATRSIFPRLSELVAGQARRLHPGRH